MSLYLNKLKVYTAVICCKTKPKKHLNEKQIQFFHCHYYVLVGLDDVITLTTHGLLAWVSRIWEDHIRANRLYFYIW